MKGTPKDPYDVESSIKKSWGSSKKAKSMESYVDNKKDKQTDNWLRLNDTGGDTND